MPMWYFEIVSRFRRIIEELYNIHMKSLKANINLVLYFLAEIDHVRYVLELSHVILIYTPSAKIVLFVQKLKGDLFLAHF